jgi:hypothetical protein
MRVRMTFRQDPSSACGGFRMTIRGFLPLLQQLGGGGLPDLFPQAERGGNDINSPVMVLGRKFLLDFRTMLCNLFSESSYCSLQQSVSIKEGLF